MFDLNVMMNLAPYSLNKQDKSKLYQSALYELTTHHYQNCLPYQKILKLLNFDISTPCALEHIPFIPVRLFKTHTLLSTEKTKIIKTMTSSGTSGQAVSKIFLYQTTATAQTKALAKITADFMGTQRLPMLVIDTKSVLKDRNLFSARGAGVLGFSILGRDITYALDENMEIDFNAVENFC